MINLFLMNEIDGIIIFLVMIDELTYYIRLKFVYKIHIFV